MKNDKSNMFNDLKYNHSNKEYKVGVKHRDEENSKNNLFKNQNYQNNKRDLIYWSRNRETL